MINMKILLLFHVHVLTVQSGELASRIAFGSCHHTHRQSLWDAIASSQPNKLLLLGDNMYADRRNFFGLSWAEATPDEIQEQYCRLNGDPSWRSLVHQMGGFENILATWDDHDYGINDGGNSYTYKNESMKLFLDFFRAPTDSGRRRQAGIYMAEKYNISVGNISLEYKIIILDARYSMQSCRFNGNCEEADMLGQAQWDWLATELNDPEVDLIFVASSVQVLPTDKLISESWFAHDPLGRKRLLSMIVHSPCHNIILLSGDVHEAEISQVFLDSNILFY